MSVGREAIWLEDAGLIGLAVLVGVSVGPVRLVVSRV